MVHFSSEASPFHGQISFPYLGEGFYPESWQACCNCYKISSVLSEFLVVSAYKNRDERDRFKWSVFQIWCLGPILGEAFIKKSIDKVNVLICLDPLPPPHNKEKKLGNFCIILDPLPPP